MKIFVLRLTPGQDLKPALKDFAAYHQIQAGFIVTAVGSFQQAALRFAGQKTSEILVGKFEIVSLVGTVSINGMHLHGTIADSQGQTIGGHLGNGCLIYTTAEIVIGEAEHLIFSREIDQQTGFQELVISPRA
jgi:uncharacterized protein